MGDPAGTVSIRLSGPPRAVDLGPVLSDARIHGASESGYRLAKIMLVYSDGREFSFDFPEPAITANDDEDLTQMQADVLESLDSYQIGDVFTNEELAAKAGYGKAGPSGPFREFMKKLERLDRVKRVTRGWKKLS